MFKTLLAFTLTLCMATSAFANCDVPKKVKKGQESPCAGYVMSPSTEEKIRIDLASKDAIIKNLTTASDLQSELIRIHSQQINVYQNELNSRAALTAWEKALYFGLGALVTGAVAYGTVQTLRR